jgi:hypothetical protein
VTGRDRTGRAIREVGDVDTVGTFVERHPRLATLLTVLAGPLDTLLLGNSLVALTGALAEPSPDEVALEHLARAVPPGRTAVVAEVAESDPGLVDEALAGLSVRIVRRPLGEVEAELDAARHAVAAAGEEARRVLRATRPAPNGPRARCHRQLGVTERAMTDAGRACPPELVWVGCRRRRFRGR